MARATSLRAFRAWALLSAAIAGGAGAATPAPDPIAPARTDSLEAGSREISPLDDLAGAPPERPAPAPYTAFPSPPAPAVAPPDTASLELPQARVKARRPDTAAVHVRADFIRRMPGAMNDPIRAAASAPGVGIQSDLNVRPLVRGGDADQTQVVLDGIPLLQPYHVGGTFSLLNLSTLETVELHRDVFPAEHPGSLSGVLRLKSRRPPADRVRARGNLSMVRGDAHVEAPLLPGRLSAWGGTQSFLFNQSLHGLLDLSSRVSGDSAFKEEIRRYQDHINMPAFRDWHWGAAFTPSAPLEAAYRGGHSTDAYAVVVPRAINVIKPSAPKDPEGSPVPVVPMLPTKEINRSKKLSIDSISSVAIANQSHFLSLKWDAAAGHYLEADLGWQTRGDSVGFKQPPGGAAEPMALSLSSRAADLRLMDTWTPRRGHRLRLGAAYSWRRHEYRADLPWVLHDMIVNGNMDMLEPLGLFAPRGFAIAKEDSSRSNFDYLGEYPARIRFRHRGTREEHLPGLFLSHTLDLASGSLTYGVRAEYHSLSRELFPAPRVDYTWRPDARNTVLVTAGLYAQSLLPYYERDRRPGLRSEKSAQLALQWSHRFSKGYRAVLGAYGKRYHDLVTPTLVPDGSIDLDGMLLPHPGSGLTAEESAALRAVIDTVQDFASLPDSTRAQAYRAFGGLEFDYSNSGTGSSLGTELAFHYDPFPAWSGWLSADLGLSSRRDALGQPTYPFRYHRPVAVNWVNWFDMPSRFDIGFAWRWALGQPYTPYTGTLDGTGSLEPVVVGARNSGRLAPFSRLDLRLSRDMRVSGKDLRAYVEVWNSMNSPNYFARDVHSGELKSAQLNWPFPLFFLGISGEI